MTISDDVLEPVQVAAQAAADKRGRNIVAFDVSEQLSITDVFLIASANNERQVGAIVDGVPATVEALRRFATDEAHRAALIANARAAGEELRERPSPYDEAARRVVALSR